MHNQSHLNAASRRNLRWAVLKLVKEAGRYGIDEGTVLDAVTSAKILATLNEMREAATYLEKKDFIEVDENQNQWGFKVTSQGIDIVEYEPDVKCPASIGRPAKYWD